jgi:hypothetical protein
VQRQVERQRVRRTPIKRLLAERWLVAGMTIEQMQRFVFQSKRPAYGFSFSNLIALPIPQLGGRGWSVEEVRITTPVSPRLGVVLTVIRYRDKVVFNFNYKSSALSRADTEEMSQYFIASLDALCGAPASA